MYLLALLTLGLTVVTAVPYVLYAILHLWVSPSGSPADKSRVQPSVSILLPTYNEESIISGKLDDILSLEYPMERVEIVVVDSSDDGTPRAVREYFSDLNVPSLTVIEEEQRAGVAQAINHAMESISSEVVFRTDCDSRLASDALTEAVANLADEEVKAVTGRQSEVLGNSDVEQEYRDITARNQALESHLDSTYICHGPCFAFERSAFKKIAPDSLADDTEIGINIRRDGGRVIMDPAIKFVESGVSRFGARRQRKDRRAMGLVQLLLRNTDALGHYGRYGRIVLPFNWWFMIISPWLAVLIALLATATAIGFFGVAGIAVLGAIVAFFWLGQREALGPFQPIHIVADALVSLLVAQIRLALGDTSGIWKVDRDSRQVFE